MLLGSGSAGFQEGSGGAVGKEGLKAAGGAVEVFETSVDRFGGVVAGVMVVRTRGCPRRAWSGPGQACRPRPGWWGRLRQLS
ncbi:hypothetical protein HMPREF9618_02301 [Cutibacterium acnes HL082PA1]|nr:hypothetical protein HMPREF9618_02301 [Cutibacterium acnes HL082PA1]